MKCAKQYADKFAKFEKSFDRMLDRIDRERKREHASKRGVKK